MSDPVSARRTLRLAFVAALVAAELTADPDTPGDRPTPPEKLPSLQVRTKDAVKTPVPPGNNGPRQFNTVIPVEVEAKFSDESQEDVQDLAEAFEAKLERAIFTSVPLNAVVQRFESVQSNFEVSSDGRVHHAGVRSVFACEIYETFDVTVDAGNPAEAPVELEEMGVHLDLAAPFDKDGTYPDPPFPDAVQDAPRTTGPDGRDEGALNLTDLNA